MTEGRYSQAYNQLFKQGPFPGRIDPWAEAGRYFPQIHAGMIGHLLDQVQDDLFDMGYVAGRENSLQIAERREPDIYIERHENVPTVSVSTWDYAAAAAEALAEPGVAIIWEVPELDALYIRELDGATGAVAEIISPGNKTARRRSEYQERRERLLNQGVNVVEIDLTRGQGLLEDKLVYPYAYNAVVYLPEELPRLIGSISASR
jgi:hypothetical protein